MAGQQQQQGGGGGGDNSMDFFWIIVIVLAALALIWYFGRDYISRFVLEWRYYEFVAIKFILDYWNKFITLMGFSPVSTAKLQDWMAFIQSKPWPVSIDRVVQVSTEAGGYLRYPFGLILLIFGFILYRSAIALKFNQIFSMQTLRKYEKENWPQITPIAELNLVKQDIDQGVWAMALTPKQFCEQNKLMDLTIKGNDVIPTLKKAEAHRIFNKQMGPLWRGNLNTLPVYMQALLAIFAARANSDTNGASELVQQINRSASTTGKLNFTGFDKLLAKNINSNKLISRVLGSHAYVYTMMAEMLVLARTDGVLPTADFLWLKPLDRNLWYVLNSVGRRTAVCEAAGPFAHWLAEISLKRPMTVPMIEQAVQALEMALKEILFDHDDYAIYQEQK